ncbi:hypothetical protein H3H36_07485 [Duganella sp. FT3S]|uniref:Uncharacterized protein n=1 Tax=Rugamonas fusca TaxID=2758568 RepID=A0A7W2EGE1_9BURK|nr:hypothetical protein [Rugamonas fusca]MBA5605200.1 hypothetical protein [Rugamonas fusca]
MIRRLGNGTSDSVAAVANGQPVAVSNGEFRIPATVMQMLGRDFFDELVKNYHQPHRQAQRPDSDQRRATSYNWTATSW